MAPRSLDLPRFMSPEVGLPPARVDEDPFLVEKRSAAAGSVATEAQSRRCSTACSRRHRRSRRLLRCPPPRWVSTTQVYRERSAKVAPTRSSLRDWAAGVASEVRQVPWAMNVCTFMFSCQCGLLITATTNNNALLHYPHTPHTLHSGGCIL
jgi:hypothetical protein